MNRTPAPRAGRIDGVLVVGGGYAGLHAARAASRAGAAVTVLDDDGRHDFVTRLAAVAGGTAPPDDAARPLDEFVDRVVLGRLAAVSDGGVRLDDGRSLVADAVVVTTGARPATPPIPGLAHARRLRTADDAIRLRAEIDDAESLVIVGGGATGVQLAGAAVAAHPTLTVHVVDTEPRLLAGLPASLSRGAERILSARGVHLHLGAPVDRIVRRGVRVGGSRLDGLVVWAGGYVADAAHLGVTVDDEGRILVDEALRIEGASRTFAAGDVAAHLDGRGRPLPMSAQTAVRAGTHAGRNAARVAAGDEPEPVALGQLGWVVDLGGRRGVARVGPIDLAGPFSDLVPPILHDLIDVKNLIEIGGIDALRFAPESVRRLVPLLPRPSWGAHLPSVMPWRLGDGRADDLPIAG